MKLTPSLPSEVIPEGEQGRKLPLLPSSLSPKEIGEGSVTITDSGFGPEPDKLSQDPELPLFLQWPKQIPIPHDIAGFYLINLKIQMTISHWEVQNTLVLQKFTNGVALQAMNFFCNWS